MWKRQRRNRLRSAPFPQEWRQVLPACCPFYTRLPEPDRRELEGHIQVFIAEKCFEGCAELTITDEVKLSIAAPACLLLLHRDTDYFPELQSIVVHPSAFQTTFVREVAYDVVEERNQTVGGVTWQDGSLSLAWDAICREKRSPEMGRNLVLHEFAHQLDFEDGLENGTPLLGKGCSRRVRKELYAEWKQTLQAEFDQLQQRVAAGTSGVLRVYGALNPMEFFAVATEAFFCKPLELQQHHPQLCNELKRYYQQDPANWPLFEPSSAAQTGSHQAATRAV